MLKIIVDFYLKPEHLITITPTAKALIEKTRQEIGCISYDLFLDEKDPSHIIFIETWENQSALDQHCQTEHFQRFISQINEYLINETRFTMLNPF